MRKRIYNEKERKPHEKNQQQSNYPYRPFRDRTPDRKYHFQQRNDSHGDLHWEGPVIGSCGCFSVCYYVFSHGHYRSGMGKERSEFCRVYGLYSASHLLRFDIPDPDSF